MFDISMEPLAASIRHHSNIAPIVIDGRPQHLSLYADDILLYVSNPELSIPPLLELIEKCGSLSGFTINWEKSELMPVYDDLDKNYLASTKFKIANHSFKYLGIIITKKNEMLLKFNWKKKIDQLKNIFFWKTLPMSMVGRINAIKNGSTSKTCICISIYSFLYPL